MEKPIFKMAKSITRSKILNGKQKRMIYKIRLYWYFGLFPETIFIMKNVCALFTMLVKQRFQC